MTRDDLTRWHREWEAELASGRVRMWAAFLVERINEELAKRDDFALRLAERIHCAHEVIGKNAEKKSGANV